MESGRGRKVRALKTSDKADRLSELINASMSKKERLAAKKGKKKRGKSSKSAFDMIRGALPEEEAELVGNLIDDADVDAEDIKVSLFEKAFSTLHEDASNPNADFRSDGAAKNMQRASLALVLSLIPEAEINYRKSGKQTDAYALNAFIDQARELANDLRMMNDADNQSEFILRRILMPMFLNLGQVLISEITGVKAIVDTEVRDNHASKQVKRSVDQMALSLGKFLTEMQGGIGAQIAAYLAGDTSSFEVPAALSGKKPANRRRNKYQMK